MSDTDKDLPWWLQPVWSPAHHPNCRAGRVDCDLPATLPGKAWRRWSRQTFPRCDWSPRHSARWWRRGSYGPPRWYINHVWEAAQRQEVRKATQAAKADFRANGDTDIDPPTRQHRHGASWSWW